MKLWDWILALDRFISRLVNGKKWFAKTRKVVMPLPPPKNGRLQIHEVLRTENGLTLRIESFLGSGGQGEVYLAQSVDDGRSWALKVIHRSKATQQAAARIRRLVELRLDRLDSRVCAPVDVIASNHLLGHISPYAHGVTLLEALEEGSLEFSESFEVATQLAQIVAKLESQSVVHGDLQAANIRILKDCSGIQVRLIDLDNFSAPNSPRPEMIGMTLYMSPELRERYLASKRVYPTTQSDRYALGIVLHETLLCFHPASGFDQTPEEIDAAMLDDWKYDPAQLNCLASPNGYPVTSLDDPIIDLLRRAISRDAAARPAPREWQRALIRALQYLNNCQTCGVPMVMEPKRQECPLGHEIQDRLKRLEHGVESVLLQSYVSIIGRSELGGDHHISRQHLVIRRLPGKLLIDVVGRNPVDVGRGGKWRTYSSGSRFQVGLEERFRIGDTAFALAVAKRGVKL